MGFMDELRKLTQPYDDEDDFFEGADLKYKPQQAAAPAQPASREQALFESSFAEGAETAQAQAQPQARPQARPVAAKAKPAKAPFAKAPVQNQFQAAAAQGDGSLFGNLGKQKPAAPKQGRVNFGGKESQVILFSPKTFDEAGEIVEHIRTGRSVVMTLEGLPTDTARRLLDFISGIAYALSGKITPVSAKTYFVTPQNVDILGAQTDAAVTDGQYL